MTPAELLAKGEIAEAIAAQAGVLRARPTDHDARWLYFVLLCYAGEPDRALLQLDMLAQQDAAFGMGSVVYRSLVTAEAERAAVFSRGGDPLLPPGCPAHVEDRLVALRAFRAGDVPGARAALERAEAGRSALEGKIDGQPFEELFDLDELLGPVLELFAGGRYLWLPIERVRKLELAPPKHQLELLWLPAQLEDAAGTTASVHLPSLYAGSSAAPDPRTRVGLMTEWIDHGGLLVRGLGQKLLLARHGSDERECPMRDVRALEIAPSTSGEATRG